MNGVAQIDDIDASCGDPGGCVIYLQPEAVSTIGDDTFWTWFNRTFESSFVTPEKLKPTDTVIRYAVLGPGQHPHETIGLCWEMYPEMVARKLHAHGDEQKVERMFACHVACDISLVPSDHQLKFFPGAYVLPIGVDTELFRPLDCERSGAIWVGTEHPMKGLPNARRWAAESGTELTVVMKGSMTQPALAQLMAQHEYVVLSGELTPLFLVEWEAMACGCKPVNASSVEREIDMLAAASDPRSYVFEEGWSRSQVQRDWEELL